LKLALELGLKAWSWVRRSPVFNHILVIRKAPNRRRLVFAMIVAL
jgi:hypothetical protein